MRIATRLLGLLMLFASLTAVLAAQSKFTVKAHPKVFAPEMEGFRPTGFEAATPPSDAVLNALLESPEVKETKVEPDRKDREVVRKMFATVQVDLGPLDEKSYVVLGGGMYTGADCHWFWIVRVRESNAQVLLFVPGLTLELLRSRTHGLRNIRERWSGNSGSVTRIYHFDGSRYKLAKEHSEGPQP